RRRDNPRRNAPAFRQHASPGQSRKVFDGRRDVRAKEENMKRLSCLTVPASPELDVKSQFLVSDLRSTPRRLNLHWSRKAVRHERWFYRAPPDSSNVRTR